MTKLVVREFINLLPTYSDRDLEVKVESSSLYRTIHESEIFMARTPRLQMLKRNLDADLMSMRNELERLQKQIAVKEKLRGLVAQELQKRTLERNRRQ